ncbi:CGNR zinc finger domain-containing protein [Leekyejoonella antrihumi]|nr:CGNR zinc finger domain-containing protein [Leekyejoonella antrihumi]
MESEFRGSPRDVAVRAVDVMAALDRAEQDQLAAVREVLRRYGEDGVDDLTGPQVEGLRAASDQLRPIVEAADASAAAAALNDVLRAYGGTPRVTSHGGSPWHLHIDEDDDGAWVTWFMSSTAMALAVLLTESQAPPLAPCGSPSCRRAFVRSMRGAPRRYCSRTCGTRERVAQLRAGRAADT